MSTQITCRLGITCVKELSNKPGPAMAALGSALEYVGLAMVNVINYWCRFEESINQCVPVFRQAF
jgi:hypothetical protein